jgi:hypothetical protein
MKKKLVDVLSSSSGDEFAKALKTLDRQANKAVKSQTKGVKKKKKKGVPA